MIVYVETSLNRESFERRMCQILGVENQTFDGPNDLILFGTSNNYGYYRYGSDEPGKYRLWFRYGEHRLNINYTNELKRRMLGVVLSYLLG